MIRKDEERGVHTVDVADAFMEELAAEWSPTCRVRIEDEELIFHKAAAEDVVEAARELLEEDIDAGDGIAVTKAEKELEAALELYDGIRDRP